MPQHVKRIALWGRVVIAGFLSFLTATPYAYPEAYVGGQLGSTVAGKSLTGVELTEVSLVTFPMQPLARVHSVSVDE